MLQLASNLKRYSLYAVNRFKVKKIFISIDDFSALRLLGFAFLNVDPLSDQFSKLIWPIFLLLERSSNMKTYKKKQIAREIPKRFLNA